MGALKSATFELKVVRVLLFLTFGKAARAGGRFWPVLNQNRVVVKVELAR